jgi:hypothetical protein
MDGKFWSGVLWCRIGNRRRAAVNTVLNCRIYKMQRISWIADQLLVSQYSLFSRKLVKEVKKETYKIHVLLHGFTAYNALKLLCYLLSVYEVWRTSRNTHKERHHEYITSSGVTGGRDGCPTCRPHPLSGVEVDTWSKPLADLVSDMSNLVPDKMYEDKWREELYIRNNLKSSYLICEVTLMTKIVYDQISG